jgi:hypothetical protein
VPPLVSGEARDEAVAGAPALADGALAAGVGLVHYYQLRAGAQEVVSAPVGLHEVGGDDDIRIAVEDGLAGAEGTLQALGSAGEDLFGVYVELVPELGLPPAGELGWTENGEAFGLSLSSSSRAMRAGSIVLPIPTSSAIKTRTGSSLSANMRGTS